MAEHSLLNLLKAMNYSGLNDLTAALNNAIQALETAKNSGKSFVEAPGAQHVKDCIDAVSALLTSSSCHPKIFVKEFSYFLMSCH